MATTDINLRLQTCETGIKEIICSFRPMLLTWQKISVKRPPIVATSLSIARFGLFLYKRKKIRRLTRTRLGLTNTRGISSANFGPWGVRHPRDITPCQLRLPVPYHGYLIRPPLSYASAKTGVYRKLPQRKELSR